MNIEVGKEYRCRDGRKARIYAIDGAETAAIHGAILYSEGWYSNFWKDGGRFVRSDHSHDLIAPWEEPVKWEAWIHVEKGQLHELRFMTEAFQIPDWARSPAPGSADRLGAMSFEKIFKQWSKESVSLHDDCHVLAEDAMKCAILWFAEQLRAYSTGVAVLEEEAIREILKEVGE